MKITRQWLKRRKACQDQVAIFDSEWPEGTEVTEASLLRAAELDLSLTWFAQHYLHSPSSWVEYRQQEERFWEKYWLQTEGFWAGYQRQTALCLWAIIAKEETS